MSFTLFIISTPDALLDDIRLVRLLYSPLLRVAEIGLLFVNLVRLNVEFDDEFVVSFPSSIILLLISNGWLSKLLVFLVITLLLLLFLKFLKCMIVPAEDKRLVVGWLVSSSIEL